MVQFQAHHFSAAEVNHLEQQTTIWLFLHHWYTLLGQLLDPTSALFPFPSAKRSLEVCSTLPLGLLPQRQLSWYSFYRSSLLTAAWEALEVHC